MVEVVNIVASTQYASTLDLTELADHIGIIFEPEQFPGMIWKMKEHSAKGRTEPMPKATILTFASGKSVVVGARTVDDIESAFAIMREQLVSGDFEIWDHPHDIALRNLVVVHQIGSNLDLKLLSDPITIRQRQNMSRNNSLVSFIARKSMVEKQFV